MPARHYRSGGLVTGLGLFLTLIAPNLAEAQQTGLFPNMGVRRERVPCAAEDPVYKLYRHEYFGYHPTCWRRFPGGWGCPSPEAPNAAAEFKKLPRDKPTSLDPDDSGEQPPANDGMRGNPSPPDPTELPLPGDTSPFDLDNKPKPKPADGEKGTGTGTPTASISTLPSLPASPLGPVRPPANPITPTTSRDSEAIDEPLQTLPDPVDNSASSRLTAPKPAPVLPGGGGSFSDPDPAAYHPQVKPAKRQTFLSSLFNGLGRRR